MVNGKKVDIPSFLVKEEIHRSSPSKSWDEDVIGST
jgi:ribosomal protein S4